MNHLPYQLEVRYLGNTSPEASGGRLASRRAGGAARQPQCTKKREYLLETRASFRYAGGWRADHGSLLDSSYSEPAIRNILTTYLADASGSIDGRPIGQETRKRILSRMYRGVPGAKRGRGARKQTMIDQGRSI